MENFKGKRRTSINKEILCLRCEHCSIPETWFIGITGFAVKDVHRAIADRNRWREEDKGDCIPRGRGTLGINAKTINLTLQSSLGKIKLATKLMLKK